MIMVLKEYSLGNVFLRNIWKIFADLPINISLFIYQNMHAWLLTNLFSFVHLYIVYLASVSAFEEFTSRRFTSRKQTH